MERFKKTEGTWMMAPSEGFSTLIMVTSDGMGKAEEPLRKKLIRTYLRLLNENGLLPGAICFYGDGVKLVVEGSHVLDELKLLESKGVHLIICNTCLNYFGLADRVAVGVVGGMVDMISAQWKAEKVITI